MTKTIKLFIVLTISWLSFTNLSAQQQGLGSVSGIIFDKTSNNPVEFANVIIRSISDSSKFMGTVTGSRGEFTFNELAFGEYKIIYSFIGFDKVETPIITLNSKQSKLNLGKLYIYELPSFVINSGFKQEIFNRKLTLIVTVSDVFNSLRNNTIVDTPELYEKIVRRRSSRIVFAGFTWIFGNQKKKELEYDNEL